MRSLSLLTAMARDLGPAEALRQLPAVALAPLTLRRLKRRKLEELSRDGFDAAHGTDTAAVLAGRELGPAVDSRRSPRHPLRDDQRGGDPAAAGRARRRPRRVRPSSTSAAARASRCSWPRRIRSAGSSGWTSRRCASPSRGATSRATGRSRIDPARVELLVADAQDFAFPPDPLVVYLYNPFPGAVLERVVANLEASLRERPRRLCGHLRQPARPRGPGGAASCSSGSRRSPTACRRPPRGAARTSAPRCSSRRAGRTRRPERQLRADSRQLRARRSVSSARGPGRCCRRTRAPTRAPRAASHRRPSRRPRPRGPRGPRWRRRAGRGPRATWPPRP